MGRGRNPAGHDEAWIAHLGGDVDLVTESFVYLRRPDSTGDIQGPLPINWDFQAIYSVKNEGTTKSGPFDVAFYVSRDNVIDASDGLPLRTVTVKSLEPGEHISLTETGLLLPNQLPEGLVGNVFLGMIVDPLNKIKETNEENNAEENNANQGIGIDQDDVTLYDPVPRPADHVFQSRFGAIVWLVRNGFRPVVSTQLAGDGGWARPLDQETRSPFDGARRGGEAYREHMPAILFDVGAGQFLVRVQGTPELGEPDPRWAFRNVRTFPDWFDYVRDWHARF